MIWGQTYNDRVLERKKWKQERRVWKSWFAWYPVRLESSGRWVWLENIEYKIDNKPGRFCSYRNFYRLKSNGTN